MKPPFTPPPSSSSSPPGSCPYQAEDVERHLEEEGAFDTAYADMALSLFDFSQKLPEIWHGSNSAVRREILECVSLNRTLSDVSVALEKRRPFDLLAERPILKDGRGDWI